MMQAVIYLIFLSTISQVYCQANHDNNTNYTTNKVEILEEKLRELESIKDIEDGLRPIFSKIRKIGEKYQNMKKLVKVDEERNVLLKNNITVAEEVQNWHRKDDGVRKTFDILLRDFGNLYKSKVENGHFKEILSENIDGLSFTINNLSKEWKCISSTTNINSENIETLLLQIEKKHYGLSTKIVMLKKAARDYNYYGKKADYLRREHKLQKSALQNLVKQYRDLQFDPGFSKQEINKKKTDFLSKVHNVMQEIHMLENYYDDVHKQVREKIIQHLNGTIIYLTAARNELSYDISIMLASDTSNTPHRLQAQFDSLDKKLDEIYEMYERFVQKLDDDKLHKLEIDLKLRISLVEETLAYLEGDVQLVKGKYSTKDGESYESMEIKINEMKEVLDEFTREEFQHLVKENPGSPVEDLSCELCKELEGIKNSTIEHYNTLLNISTIPFEQSNSLKRQISIFNIYTSVDEFNDYIHSFCERFGYPLQICNELQTTTERWNLIEDKIPELIDLEYEITEVLTNFPYSSEIMEGLKTNWKVLAVEIDNMVGLYESIVTEYEKKWRSIDDCEILEFDEIIRPLEMMMRNSEAVLRKFKHDMNIEKDYLMVVKGSHDTPNEKLSYTIGNEAIVVDEIPFENEDDYDPTLFDNQFGNEDDPEIALPPPGSQ